MENSYYSKVYREVIEYLRHLNKEDFEKIPKELISYFENNMDKDYDYKIDITKGIENQVMLDETALIIIMLYEDYFADNDQKVKLLKYFNINDTIIEFKKSTKYNPDSIF